MQSVREYLLKLFFPQSALCLIFLTLTFLDMIWVHIIHVLGMLGVLGVCNMLQHPLAHASDMLCGPNAEVYGCKTWQGQRKQGKIQTEDTKLWQYKNHPAILRRGGCCFPLLGHPKKISPQSQSKVPSNLISRHISPLYTRSQGQCATQIKHSYCCKSWNQP
jgi:hypothetical protein